MFEVIGIRYTIVAFSFLHEGRDGSMVWPVAILEE
jgi:hypothetical protein